MTTSALKEDYGTLSETMNALRKLGYKHDFNIEKECLVCHETNVQLSPDDFQIDKFYRFEGPSDPDDNSILYAISSASNNIMGVLVNAYGVHSDPAAAALIDKLETNVKAQPSQSNSSATPSDQNGSHLKDPLFEIDLEDKIDAIKKDRIWSDRETVSNTLYTSDGMRLILMGMRKKAHLAPHTAKGSITVQVLDGSIEFTANDHTVRLDKGQITALNAGTIHSVTALKDSFFLLTMAIGG